MADETPTLAPVITCPSCGGMVARRQDGALFPHKRYVDGGGPEAGLDHTLTDCEGEVRNG